MRLTTHTRWRDWTTWTGIAGVGINTAALVTRIQWPITDQGDRWLFWFIQLPLALATGSLLYGALPWWLRKRSRIYSRLGIAGPGRTIAATLIGVAALAAVLHSSQDARLASAVVAAALTETDAEVTQLERDTYRAVEALSTELHQQEREMTRIADAVGDSYRYAMRDLTTEVAALRARVTRLASCLDAVSSNRVSLTLGEGFYSRRVTVLSAPYLLGC